MIKQYQTAIITGASRGIGVYIARALAKEGMNLVLAARTKSDLDKVASEMSALGVRAIAVPTDIGDKDALAKLVASAEAEFGAIDVLVNNAALDSVMAFHKEKIETIEQNISINLTAAMVLTRLVLPGMLQRKRGHIVNIASLAAKIPFPHDVLYATSKAGLVHFTASLRAEYRGSGVSASAILAGGFTDEGLSKRALEEAGFPKPNSVPTSPPADAGQAVIQAIRTDASEIAIPAPAILFTRIPQLGVFFLKQTGIIDMLKRIAETRSDKEA